MMHRVAHRKLGIRTQHRQALLANMVSSLVMHDRIRTTLTRAKEVRRIADKVVTLSKKGTLHARRQAISLLRNQEAVQKAFSSLPERFSDRKGGYTRIYQLGIRHGDAAPMALLEYLSETSKVADSTPQKTKGKAKAAAPAETKEKKSKTSKLASLVKRTTKKATTKKA